MSETKVSPGPEALGALRSPALDGPDGGSFISPNLGTTLGEPLGPQSPQIHPGGAGGDTA